MITNSKVAVTVDLLAALQGQTTDFFRPIRAVKACGCLIELKPADFIELVARTEEPLVVLAHTGIILKTFEYMTSYKNFCFHTESKTVLKFTNKIELVVAAKMTIPDL